MHCFSVWIWSTSRMGKTITIPRWAAILAGVLFVGGMVTVGLCVHYLAPPLEQATEAPTTTAIATTTTPTPAGSMYRLPRHVVPLEYEIKILSFLDSFTFNGEVNILIDCVSSSNNITLHYRDLTFETVQVQEVEGAVIDILRQSYEPTNNQYVLHLATALKAGSTYRFSAKYSGIINNDLEGFYRASYVDTAGNTRWVGITQFEAIGARRVFPCFDEPNFKARFSLTLGRPANLKTFGNVDQVQTGLPVEGFEGMVWDVYGKTNIMSTYLVAFCISDFNRFPGRTTTNGIPTGTIADTTYDERQAVLSNEVTASILEFYQDYTGINYSYPKLDNLGVSQFSFGAMENWGLVVYRDNILMYDGPETTPATTYKRIVQIIAHELAHQWFGDLVTLDWWSMIFLNEGFATLLEYKGLGAQNVRPSWNPEHFFVSETLQYVMRGTDSLESSRALYLPIDDNDIMKYFDDIAYEKGGSVLRMIEHAIGVDTFQKGIRNYLRTLSYQNAKVEDLVFHLNAAAVEDGASLPAGGLDAVMSTWVYQKNFPLITVNRQYGSGTATVSQRRFLRNPYPRAAEEYYWWVPVSYTQDFTEVKNQWLPNNQDNVQVAGLDDSDFVIFNVDQKGYYRVNYDAMNWLKIAQALSTNKDSINVINRAQIVDDALHLAQQGYITYSTAMATTRFLKAEREWLPWSSFDANAVFLDSMIVGQDAYANFRIYILRLVKPLYEFLTFEEGSAEDLLPLFSRTLAVKWACKFGLPDCVSNSNQLYDAWVTDSGVGASTVPPNLKSTVLCTAIHNGDSSDFDNAVEILKASKDKASIATALTCSTDAVLIAKLLGWTTTDVDSPIPKGDLSDAIYRNLAQNPIGRTQAFRYITDNWEQIKSFYSASVGARWLTFVTAYFNKESEVDALVAFRDAHTNEPDTVAGLTAAVERAQANVEWAGKYYSDIADWLANEVAN